jgi:hypothetical protein
LLKPVDRAQFPSKQADLFPSKASRAFFFPLIERTKVLLPEDQVDKILEIARKILAERRFQGGSLHTERHSQNRGARSEANLPL